jgi:hypothetical protein
MLNFQLYLWEKEGTLAQGPRPVKKSTEPCYSNFGCPTMTRGGRTLAWIFKKVGEQLGNTNRPEIGTARRWELL